ncbi:MAG TPA: hypothetical protein VL202_18615 [Pararhizobium sp.]|uniref:hypothetical protein n=1 Tax=Pararhizobium sp. TaxID=1977563 RepID=UPI002C97BCE1|nr:hypothetical protein [Pararhizobium sp.]HTO33165.1 hypothetical protein [Pararhizobium sp.]
MLPKWLLVLGQSDIDCSRPSVNADLAGWSIGLVDLRNIPQSGWYNSTHAQVTASLDITRQPGVVVASIFIPLFAPLLIPLLAIWLNHMEDGVFQVDTHEMVNIIIGCLFAVIALNFAVYSTYVVLSSGDNTVNRLLALNYLTQPQRCSSTSCLPAISSAGFSAPLCRNRPIWC